MPSISSRTIASTLCAARTPNGEFRINPRGELADEPGAEHQLVRDGLGIRGVVT